MTAYATLNKNFSDLTTEILDYLVANEIDYESTPPFKKLGDASTLSNDIPSISTILDEYSLSLKDMFIYVIYPFEVVVSSPGQYIIFPLDNYHNSSFSINEPNPDAELQEALYYDLGYYDIEDTVELERVDYSDNTIYLFNSNVYTSVRYEGDTMPLFLCATVNEDLSSYFTE